MLYVVCCMLYVVCCMLYVVLIVSASMPNGFIHHFAGLHMKFRYFNYNLQLAGDQVHFVTLY